MNDGCLQGVARELVSQVQALRKASKLSVGDAVEVTIDGTYASLCSVCDACYCKQTRLCCRCHYVPAVEPYDAVRLGVQAPPHPPIVIASTCGVKAPKASAAAGGAGGKGKAAAAPAAAAASVAAPVDTAAYVKGVLGKAFASLLEALGGTQVVPNVPALGSKFAVVSTGRQLHAHCFELCCSPCLMRHNDWIPCSL